ncbi:conserved hypothetical protein [Talaromyces stipitatus ATCC 10500]|uniref:Uncharacterized protein n=1 Tax=Talaromyces stipitatus (strain ATCC 10500 / CBS 375.48 / QM 6759 / NRRL 1006) TaxID=441959 RepID=B8MC79_TALSN|nr:uncharacterized protein TSTA_122570 [Talaromyces stipitatus ATCC 10500]EED18525.1 conserved hypothetical protein [Talaromyces stipitatus ATCC 10500]
MFSQRYIPFFGLFLSTGALAVSQASKDVAGYAYGQPIPVSCLNRTIDSGEHIRDSLGRLQYIPFPTCNETSSPLALHYGVTETVSCTIDSLPDELYHLLEYYVHSDAPLTCRVPTIPLDGDSTSVEYDVGGSTSSNGGSLTNNENSGPPYTPLTIALQGTLQLSHLHIWTDMNVLMHRLSSVESPRKEEEIQIKKQAKKKALGRTISPGYIVAGTAYSLPELHAATKTDKSEIVISEEEEDAAIIENARNPWTAGHGSKVVRGEPLTLKFRVSWVSGADSLGWLDREDDSAHIHHAHEGTTFLGLLTKLIFFVMAAGIGALFASYYQRVVRRGGSAGGGGPGAWRGEGILGRPMMATASSKGQRRGSFSGVTYGNGGRSNGYGGYSPASSVTSTPGNGGYGYGGYGKKD